jgi:hypothetical protein
MTDICATACRAVAVVAGRVSSLWYLAVMGCEPAEFSCILSAADGCGSSVAAVGLKKVRSSSVAVSCGSSVAVVLGSSLAVSCGSSVAVVRGSSLAVGCGSSQAVGCGSSQVASCGSSLAVCGSSSQAVRLTRLLCDRSHPAKPGLCVPGLQPVQCPGARELPRS